MWYGHGRTCCYEPAVATSKADPKGTGGNPSKSATAASTVRVSSGNFVLGGSRGHGELEGEGAGGECVILVILKS